MHQTLKDRLAKAALAEISHLEWSMLNDQQQQEMYELVDCFANALQNNEALLRAITRSTMEPIDVQPGSLIGKALVPRELIVTGLIDSLFAFGNKARWKQ